MRAPALHPTQERMQVRILREIRMEACPLHSQEIQIRSVQHKPNRANILPRRPPSRRENAVIYVEAGTI